MGMVQSDWAKPVGLGVMALSAMVLMLAMVRNASRLPTMPKPEDLAGVPPVLPTDEDLFGEAEESESAMAGVEIDENYLLPGAEG